MCSTPSPILKATKGQHTIERTYKLFCYEVGIDNAKAASDYGKESTSSYSIGY